MSAFGKMRACVSFRALALLEETSWRNLWRSFLVNSTTYYFSMTGLFTDNLPANTTKPAISIGKKDPTKSINSLAKEH
jgi:hypothetical protein